ncbi:MAG: leucyl/phenylalanyl-tRNA--protein transferase, partial [Burkholderiales bacterium]
MQTTPRRPVPWLEPGDPLPPIERTWDEQDPVPGLLAAGGSLTVPSLLAAYSRTVFPWFSRGEPILWWSPDPRMVLRLSQFKLHRSLKQSIVRFQRHASAEIRIDTAFEDVIRACAGKSRNGQSGTWIGPEMIDAYFSLHRAGHAHSVETWLGGRLVAGLYCVAIGRAVFGESMFTTVPDGSKIA